MPTTQPLDAQWNHAPSTTSMRSGTTTRAVLVAVLSALALAALGRMYFATAAGDSYPEPNPAWTD